MILKWASSCQHTVEATVYYSDDGESSDDDEVRLPPPRTPGAWRDNVNCEMPLYGQTLQGLPELTPQCGWRA
jgi:hypothetical protein